MIEITHGTPTTPGLYLWRGELSGKIELIHVYQVPDCVDYGNRWRSYLAVAEHNGHSIEKLLGKFSKNLQITDEGILKVVEE